MLISLQAFFKREELELKGRKVKANLSLCALWMSMINGDGVLLIFTWAASPHLCRFPPGEHSPSTSLWVGPRANVDTLDKRFVSYFYLQSNHHSSDMEPITGSLYWLSYSDYERIRDVNSILIYLEWIFLL